MISRPPFFAQERRETCALACLRMVLARNGILTTEEALVRKAPVQPGGLPIDDLEKLARSFGVRAEARRMSIEDVEVLVRGGIFPIVYVLLQPEGGWTSHAVIPIEVSPASVLVLDPLLPPPGERRLSRSDFVAAQRWLGNWAVVAE